jgi:hypothetical protein
MSSSRELVDKAEADAGKRFRADTTDHAMTVLHEDGLYRHLRFRNPETSEYWFDLVTWPYSLVVNGDMGSFHFSRVGSDTEDMFRLFRGKSGSINPDYWAQKLSVGRTDAEEYSQAKFRQVIAEQVEGDRVLSALVKTEILDDENTSSEEGARNLLEFFTHEGFRFTDTWEFNFNDWTYHYLWCCHSIVGGIAQYDAAKVTPPVPALDAAATAEVPAEVAPAVLVTS